MYKAICLETKKFVTGYLVGDYIVGEVLESCEDYIVLQYWNKIDVNTIEML